MAKTIPTLYSDYNQLLLDISIYGNTVSVPQLDLSERRDNLFEEFKRQRPLPSMEQERYKLSNLVSTDYKVNYEQELELQENENLMEFNSSSGEYTPTEEFTLPLNIQSLFTYEQNILDDDREALLRKYNITTGDMFDGDIEQVEQTFGTVQDNKQVLSDDEIDNLGSEENVQVTDDSSIEFEDEIVLEDFNMNMGTSYTQSEDEDIEEDEFDDESEDIEYEEDSEDDEYEEDYIDEDENDEYEDDSDEEYEEDDSDDEEEWEDEEDEEIDEEYEDEDEEYEDEDEDLDNDVEDSEPEIIQVQPQVQVQPSPPPQEPIQTVTTSTSDSYEEGESDEEYEDESEDDEEWEDDEEYEEEIEEDEEEYEEEYEDEDDSEDEDDESDYVEPVQIQQPQQVIQPQQAEVVQPQVQPQQAEVVQPQVQPQEQKIDTVQEKAKEIIQTAQVQQESHFIDSILDESDEDEIEFIAEENKDKVIETPKPPIQTKIQKEPEVVEEEKPTDLRQFLRKHPRCEYSLALKYFSEKEIKDMIRKGKVIKKGNILRI